MRTYTSLTSAKKNLQAITDFYDAHFPALSLEFRDKFYFDKARRTMVFFVKDNDKIIALLESALDKNDKNIRVLRTIVVDKDYRHQGLAQKLINKLINLNDSPTLAVAFREKNRKKLEGFYASFGFGNIVPFGTYPDGEQKFRMTIIPKKSLAFRIKRCYYYLVNFGFLARR